LTLLQDEIIEKLEQLLRESVKAARKDKIAFKREIEMV
jgi:hypothetical protein